MIKVGKPHRFRIFWFCASLLAAFAVLGCRLLWQGMVKQPRMEEVAQSAFLQQKLQARRGTIFDRSLKHRFAYEEDAYRLTVDKKHLPTEEAIADFAKRLAPCLQMKVEDLQSQLQKKSRYILIRSQGNSYFPSEIVQPLLQQKEKKQWKELSVTSGVRRNYGPYASHVLGFVDEDGNPRGGIESYYDKELRGQEGWQSYAKTRQGTMIGDAPQSEQSATPGAHLVLTLDAQIQREVEHILKESVESRKAKGGAAVVIDPYNGEILALASMPSFSSQFYSSTVNTINQRNHLIHSVYEPGSVFKIISLAAIIEELGLDPNGSYFSKPVYLENHVIREWNGGGFGNITNRRAVEQSSNTLFVNKILQMKADRFAVHLRNFGIGDLLTSQGFRTGIDLPGESMALLPSVPLMTSALASTSFGQSIAITLLQQVSATAAVAQGGMLYKPHLLKEVRDSNCQLPEACRVLRSNSVEGRRVIQESTAEQIRSFLEGVVKNGTGKKADIPEYSIAGKTGTAQKADPVHGGYVSGKSLVTFTGWAPSKQPDIAILVALDEPEVGGETASEVAAMVKRILPIRGIAPESKVRNSAKKP